MLEGEIWKSLNGHGIGIERENVDAVVVIFEEAPNGDSVAGGSVCSAERRESHGVEWIR